MVQESTDMGQLSINTSYLCEKVGFVHPPSEAKDLYNIDMWYTMGPNLSLRKLTRVLHPHK